MANRADNFNRTDGSNLIGSTPSDGLSAWSDPSGESWAVYNASGTDGQAGMSSSGSGTPVLDCGSADGETQVTLTTLGGSLNAGIIFRLTDANNYYRLFVASYARLFKVEAGATTGLGDDASFTPTAGDVYKVHHAGSTIQVYRNGSLLTGIGTGGTATDSFNATATKHGLYANGDTGTRFDTFSFTDLAAGTPKSRFFFLQHVAGAR